jgi:hypothetical protein
MVPNQEAGIEFRGLLFARRRQFLHAEDGLSSRFGRAPGRSDVRGTTRTGFSHLLLGFLDRGVVKYRLEDLARTG